MTTSQPRVLVTNSMPASALQPLDGVAHVILGASNDETMSRPEVLALAPSLTGIINQAELQVDGELLDAAPQLKIVANVALGTDNMDLELMSQRGVWATNAPESFVASTADCTLGLLLAMTRNIPAADEFVRSGNWNSIQPGRWDGVELDGKTLGLVGFGRIGQAVARRAEAFGLRIIFTSTHPRQDARWHPLERLLRESDIVSLHVPLTESTRHLMSARRFGQMKRGAFFINMARGKTMDESALVEKLQEGHLSGAALDVFENEPDVHPALLRLSNVVLTPHLGGGTHESRASSRLLASQNVAAVLAGQPPRSPVNKAATLPA